MADRSRDLKISILSDTQRAQFDKPAEQLDDLADAAVDAGKALDKLDDDSTTRALDKLGDKAKTTGTRLDGLGDDLDDVADQGKKSADKLDDSFDAISRSADDAATKTRTETKKISRAMKDAGDEGKDSLRETFASIGDVADLGDAAKEIATNVGALFGPIGLGIGGALSAGIALFKANADKLKEDIESIFSSIKEGAGQLGLEVIKKRIEEIPVDDLVDIAKVAQEAGIATGTLVAAVAGDPESLRLVGSYLEALNGQLVTAISQHGTYSKEAETLRERQHALQATLGNTPEAVKVADQAYAVLSQGQSSAADNAEAASRRLVAASDAAGQGIPAALRNAIPGVGQAAAAIHAAAQAQLSRPLSATATLDLNTAAFDRKLASKRAELKYAAQDRYTP